MSTNNKSVTEVLKEATKDLLTEDTLKQIETIHLDTTTSPSLAIF